MQIDELTFYSRSGLIRSISLMPGRLNIITGDSRTGKSSLINIIRFLLGDGNPHAPRGPIQQSVAWYGMRGHVGETPFFIGRPAPGGDSETNETMLIVGDVPAPPFDGLASNTTSAALRDYLGGLLGIEDNLTVPPLGQTRQQLSATFVHSLYYCFQGQGEIANPDILFHRQNREWIPQTIRDTLPFFLGAQGAEDLRRREQLAERRRELRRLQQRLRAAEAERTAGLDRAGSLITEAVDVGLLAAQPELTDLNAVRGILRGVLDGPPAVADEVEVGGQFERMRHRRSEINNGLREFADQLQGLDEFAAAEGSYVGELSEQRARLASIGLVPGDTTDAACTMCGQALGEHTSPSHQAITQALERAGRRLDLAQRDRPRIQRARSALLEQRTALRNEANDIDRSLDALAAQDELVNRARDAVNVQSYVRGRIALYFDATEDVGNEELETLRTQVSSIEQAVAELTDLLDAAALRSRTTSLLRSVSRQMMDWSRQLGLEHAADGVQIDLDRLTIVADTPQGPAYMDRGEIGSGMNWVGYHLTAYLALQAFFIEHHRPVPGFLVLDQPSQAFFPRDREAGGDLDELTDTDREHTRQLYQLVHNVVDQLSGKLQVIALDHADFDDSWFAESVVQRWRDGQALIPSSWCE
jgi:hypothetical protein